MEKINRVKILALLTIIVTYILIVFGGYVASSESGMGCGPEWPLCNGDVIPVMQGETLIEFAHRVIGLFLFVLSLMLFILIIKKSNDNHLRFASKWMMGLLTIQVLAGAVVVVLDLPTIVVTLHLLVAMIFMFTLLWIYRSVDYKKAKLIMPFQKQKKAIFHLNILLVLLLLTLAFGAYIKHESYGLACDWLDCRSTVLPTNGPQLLQTTHRLLAVLTAVYTIFLTLYSYMKNWDSTLKRRLNLALLTVLLQLSSGVMAVLTNISIPWAVLHLAIGTVLFIIVAEARIIMSPHSLDIHIEQNRVHNHFK